MSVDEQELRNRLEGAAAQASPPRLTVAGLTRRVRRRRAKILAAVSGTLLAVAAVAVAVPIGLSSPGSAGNPVTAAPGVPPFTLAYTVTVNGRPVVFPKNGTTPRVGVTPGEGLRIDVDVTVPAHFTRAWIRTHPRWPARRAPVVTALWLGISRGVWGNGRGGRPRGINYPMLAQSRKPLGPGSHRFQLRWTVPAGLRPGASRSLAAAWNAPQEAAAEPVVTLTVRPFLRQAG